MNYLVINQKQNTDETSMIRKSHTTCPDLARRESLLQRVPSNTFKNEKNNHMKKLFKAFLLIAIVSSFSITGLKAQISAGAGVVYGTNINTVGFSVHGKYEFTDKWSADPAFTYFLKKDEVTWMALDFDANYILTEIDNVGKLYGIGGLNVTFYKINYEFDLREYTLNHTKSASVYNPEATVYSTSASGSNIGLNLGIGLKVPVGRDMAVFPEIKYTISDGGYLRIGAKFMFGF
jgi:hypothetical protein